MSEQEPTPKPDPTKPEAPEASSDAKKGGIISRRRFLAGAIGAGVGSAIGITNAKYEYLQKLLGAGGHTENSRVEGMTPETKLKEAGLEYYEGVYKELDEFSRKYGSAFYEWNVGAPFPVINNLANALNGVARAEKGSVLGKEVMFWREGWKTHVAKGPQDAKEHIKKITVYPEQTIDADKLRTVAASITGVLPALATAMPDKLGTKLSGGGVFLGEEIDIELSRAHPINSLYYAIHEAQHSFLLKTLPDIKKYLDPQQFADYIQTYLHAVGTTMDEWTDAPFSKAIAFVRLNDIAQDIPPAQAELDSMERTVSAHFADLPSDIAIPADEISKEQDPREKLVIRYNQIAHSVTRTWRTLQETQPDHAMLNDPNVRSIVDKVFSDMAHRFVFDSTKLNNPTESTIKKEHMKVWTAFLKAFSSADHDITAENFLKQLDSSELMRRGEIYKSFGMRPVVINNQTGPNVCAPYAIYKFADSNVHDEELCYFEFSNFAQGENYNTAYSIFSVPKDADLTNISFVKSTDNFKNVDEVLRFNIGKEQHQIYTNTAGPDPNNTRGKLKVYGLFVTPSIGKALNDPTERIVNTRNTKGEVTKTDRQTVVFVERDKDTIIPYIATSQMRDIKNSEVLYMDFNGRDSLGVINNGDSHITVNEWMRRLHNASKGGNISASDITEMGEGKFGSAAMGWGFQSKSDADSIRAEFKYPNVAYQLKVAKTGQNNPQYLVQEYHSEKSSAEIRYIKTDEVFLIDK